MVLCKACEFKICLVKELLSKHKNNYFAGKRAHEPLFRLRKYPL